MYIRIITPVHVPPPSFFSYFADIILVVIKQNKMAMTQGDSMDK